MVNCPMIVNFFLRRKKILQQKQLRNEDQDKKVMKNFSTAVVHQHYQKKNQFSFRVPLKNKKPYKVPGPPAFFSVISLYHRNTYPDTGNGVE